MQPARSGDRQNPRGFTLIELLIVVAIIGIIAAILVPNLLGALEKAKQKRTVADIQEVGTALMSWLTDQVGASAAGAARSYDFNDLSIPLTASEVLGTLYISSSMYYVATVPFKDGWGNPLDYAWSGQILGARVIGVRSLARDAQEGPSMNPYPLGPFATTHFDEDIVWADGLFIRYPAGTRVD